ncbi:hypothetical protein K457DRAFT_417854 [Linnemannia elongata AG-77]|uniref:Uncharacterized protein n=1 Tax=Linnemannia elongata AG-77 TaxID=1314771 RepID=A0A197K0K4_9FUNG|nr:hypothetical protein K457DRAFT_417854 [Linnemannia elongata AG-77]
MFFGGGAGPLLFLFSCLSLSEGCPISFWHTFSFLLPIVLLRSVCLEGCLFISVRCTRQPASFFILTLSSCSQLTSHPSPFIWFFFSPPSLPISIPFFLKKKRNTHTIRLSLLVPLSCPSHLPFAHVSLSSSSVPPDLTTPFPQRFASSTNFVMKYYSFPLNSIIFNCFLFPAANSSLSSTFHLHSFTLPFPFSVLSSPTIPTWSRNSGKKIK